MPQVVNTFIKSKMNKDLDNRLLPNGEYRDARNLQISRSQGSEVGEFENVLGNQQLTYLYTGKNGFAYSGKIIGQFTDETNNILYIYSAGYNGDGRCPRDLVFTAAPNLLQSRVTTFALYTPGGALLNPLVSGVKEGMLLWGDNWNGQPSAQGGQRVDPIVTNVTATDITVSQACDFADSGGLGTPGDTINIGFTNTIHEYNINTGVLTLLVRGSFLNFHQDFRIYGINLIEDLLFWTDNRNQPRKINVTLANPTSLISPNHYVNEDQISVAKYYPYEVPLVLHQTILTIDSGAQAGGLLKGYVLTCPAAQPDGSTTDLSNLKIGDIVSGFPGQEKEELWNIIDIDNTAKTITIYNNFKDGNSANGMQPGTWDQATDVALKFSSSTMKNSAEEFFKRGYKSKVITGPGPIAAGTAITCNYPFNNTATEPESQPSVRVGDFITSLLLTGPSGLGITISDEVVITEIVSYDYVAKQIQIKLNKDITINGANDDIKLGVNPNYESTFTGDPDLIEEKFIRFSYRFKFEDNEYSLAAPYTQICFIPKQDGYYGGGKNDQLQDMINNYDSSIVEWFTNKVDTISLNIPLPGGNSPTTAIDDLINGYKVKEIEILYKESDALSTKILEVIDINPASDVYVKSIPVNFGQTTPKWFYQFDYKSIKPYRTLPTSEQNRVYDNVPLKALGQEISANRVIYGNFLQKHTPPASINYEVIQSDKSVEYDNYAQYPNHSLKQNRNYQVGFVLSDRYGRASSVVLSSNDSNPNLSGSTLYVPYKDFADIGGPEARQSDGVSSSKENVYSWLGNVLRVKVNNGISTLTNDPVTGQPGLYKSEEDTSVDAITINNGGSGYVVGDLITFTYEVTAFTNFRGLGSGLTAKVTTESGNVITGLEIVSRGNGYLNGQQLIQLSTTGAGVGVIVTATVFDANPTGWQSYKLVVKQQEQEYYNVYLPGYVSGYPVTITKETGRIAFAALLGDNINKVPRDLNEVGPLQTEFSASVKLFGRVNNPDINNTNKGSANFYYVSREYPWNTQYFPGRNADEAVTVGPIGEGGLELANSPFEPGIPTGQAVKGPFFNGGDNLAPPATPQGQPDLRTKLPWGVPGREQSFYNAEQNPLAIGLKIGAEEAQPQLLQEPDFVQLNTLGARVTGNPVPATLVPPTIACMVPFLSVSETLPVESQLEIFYESSSSGNFVELNRTVTAGYAGVSGATVSSASFDESVTVGGTGSTVITAFSFTDSAGNKLTLQGVPTITSITDGNGTSAPGAFTITQNGATPLDFDINTNQLFACLAPAGALLGSNKFLLSFTTTYNNGSETFVDDLPNLIEITLNNVAPEIGGFTPAYGASSGTELTCGLAGGATGYDPTMTGVLGQFTNGVNGSADPTQNTDELCWTLTVDSVPAGNTATFDIDQCTGELEQTGGTTVNGDYDFTATLTDAAPGCPTCTPSTVSLTQTCSIKLVYGTPPTNQAICFGPTSRMGPTFIDTSCRGNSGSSCAAPPAAAAGDQLEVFWVLSNSQFSDHGLNSYILTVEPGITGTNKKYTTNLGQGTSRVKYNVLYEARDRPNPNGKWECIDPGPPPAIVTPAFTTGALTQGVMAIEVILTKFAIPNNGFTQEYKTNYLIVHRASASDPWLPATYIRKYDNNGGATPQPSEDLAGGTVGSAEELFPIVTSNTQTVHKVRYDFSAPGEYALRNNGVYGAGCAQVNCVNTNFTVNFYDATQFPYDNSLSGDARFNSGPVANGCLNTPAGCQGAL